MGNCIGPGGLDKAGHLIDLQEPKKVFYSSFPKPCFCHVSVSQSYSRKSHVKEKLDSRVLKPNPPVQ